MSDASLKQNAAARIAIMWLEAGQARIVREHLLGDPTALARLKTLDTQIAALRPNITDGAPP